MKKFLVILIILIVVGVVVVLFSGRKSVSLPFKFPGVSAPAPDDTTAVINQELNSIDVGDIDQEFQAIDRELNNL